MQTLTCINPSRSYRVGKLFMNALAMGCLLFASCKKDTGLTDEENITPGSAKNSARIATTTICDDQDRDMGIHSMQSWWSPKVSLIKACKTYTGDDTTVTTFKYDWNVNSGGTIGGIEKGASSKSPGYPCQIKDVRDWTTSVTMNKATTTNDGRWVFGIYGWTDDETPGYPWQDEFYITEYKSPLKGDGIDPKIGELTLPSGAIYDMYKGQFKDQDGNPNGKFRLKAVRRTPRTGSMTVNMKPFFDFWRNMNYNPMRDTDPIVRLGWAVETFGGTTGTVNLTNIDLPQLK